MSKVTDLREAVKQGDGSKMKELLEADRALDNARGESDARGAFPLHVAAEFGQAGAARLLLAYGADMAARDTQNDATALGWAAFFGRPKVVRLLLDAGAEVNQRNKHGLTPLGCATGGAEGKWREFSNATLAEWRECANAIASFGGYE
jgi:ankyrin repeat protein